MQKYTANKRFALALKNTHRLKVKGQEKIFHTNRNPKRAGVAIFISDKIDFQLQLVTRDKECPYIVIKRLIHKEAIKL